MHERERGEGGERVGGGDRDRERERETETETERKSRQDSEKRWGFQLVPKTLVTFNFPHATWKLIPSAKATQSTTT